MPYRYTNTKGRVYSLRGKTVLLQNGRRQRLYYFAPDAEPGVLEELPAGHTVVENRRTGLPYLKRDSTEAPAPAQKGP
jgi:hypothetical protein